MTDDYTFYTQLKNRLAFKFNSQIDFLSAYFSAGFSKDIIQVGANDGVMCDPLRFFLETPSGYRATLIEPIPYYVEKLTNLYVNRQDIRIVQTAISCDDSVKKLYFIKPEVADLMNGDGPKNDWAHGQGSFSKETVIHWINENSFRGNEYRKNIPLFISSIDSVVIPTKKISEFIPSASHVLLVLDVQGFEYEVLQGVEWSNRPKFIYLEDDLGNGQKIAKFLAQKGYLYLCGSGDKVFVYVGLNGH